MSENTTEGPEKWVPDALDEQEAYLAGLLGTLHRPVTVTQPEDSDEDDLIYCETCGEDLRSQSFCENVPIGRCGCPLYMILDGEHLPHE